jgi:peptide/nickel transport system permease protein
VRVATVVAISIPSYWLAVLCLVVAGERWPDLVPGAGGFTRFGEDPLASVRALLLPAVVLGLGGFAMVARSLRASLAGVLDGDDVHFARAMGMPERQVLGRIALRAVAPSTVTVVGLLLGGLVSGTLLVENVFALPGLGQLMVTAFTRGDHPLALGTALVTALVFLGLNLAVDVAVVALDPRARRGLPSGSR